MTKIDDIEPAMDRLLAVMAKLRDPEGGCPWDLEQDFASIAPYTIEEAYEVADAIRRQDHVHLREELGDLLLQVVFHSQMAEEAEHFAFQDVAAHIADKMIRRHPHVFADGKERDAHTQTKAWEQQKAEERAEKAARYGEKSSVLADVALALPALMRAEKLQKRAARVGFDWPDALPVFAKIEEECREIREAMAGDEGAERLSEEVGDLLFSVVNLARKLGLDPEVALRGANDKFQTRFEGIEQALSKAGKAPEDASLDEMEVLWQQMKS